MRRTGWIAAAAVLAALALAWCAAQPLYAFQALADAGRAGDRDRLAALVDFPAVRADLEAQLDARLAGALAKDRGLAEGPFGRLGALLAPQVVDRVVEAAVTPEGVAAIVRSGRAPLSDLTRGKTALPPPPDTAPPATDETARRPRTRFAYTGPNTFEATTFSRDGAALGWVMARRGLGWKLVGIQLPP
jgi:hypothetical protein